MRELHFDMFKMAGRDLLDFGFTFILFANFDHKDIVVIVFDDAHNLKTFVTGVVIPCGMSAEQSATFLDSVVGQANNVAGLEIIYHSFHLISGQQFVVVFPETLDSRLAAVLVRRNKPVGITIGNEGLFDSIG